MQALHNLSCKDSSISAEPVNENEIAAFLDTLNTWQYNQADKVISCRYQFKNYEKTLKFINHVAEIAIEQDHHPEIQFGYNYCSIKYSTHETNYVTMKDLICAAKIEQLHTQNLK